MSNVFALRDSLAGLAGDTDAHASTVAAEFGRAVLLCAQHGNKNPLDSAHEFMGTLKGSSKAIKAVKDGYAAAIAAAGFLVVTEKALADGRDKGAKRMPAPDALALSESVAEAFVLAFATRYNAPAKARAEKPAAAKVDVVIDQPSAIIADVGIDQPTVNDLQTQLESITAERDALRVGNAALSAMVAALKAELLALTPAAPQETRETPESELSVNAREQLAVAVFWAAKDATDKAQGLAPIGTAERTLQAARAGKKARRQAATA